MKVRATMSAILLASLGARAQVTFDERTLARVLQHSPLPPPPPDPTNRVADSDEAARLGQALFFDKRLSKNGELACATCHDPLKAFADGRSLAQGLTLASRHAPSLYNVAHQRWFFWDGRADSLWCQALQPLESPSEMGSDRATIVRLIANDAALRAGYERVFGSLPDLASDPNVATLVFVNTAKSIESFERRLISADSRFDRYVKALRAHDVAGQDAYPDAAKRGVALFVGRADCRACHAGPLFSDGEFHDVGVPSLDKKPPRDAGRRGGIELLRRDPFNAGGDFSDERAGARAREIADLASGADRWGQFRTPSLRNVARTAPYMHQGQFATLPVVLEFYSTRAGAVALGHHGEQVLKPLHLTDEEKADLLAFLETLTDESLAIELRAAPDPATLARPISARPAER